MSEPADSPPSAQRPHVASSPETPDIVTPTPVELFLGFFKVTLIGFGGVLAWARREMVIDRRWMTPDEFNELFALCQFLPGPNIVNFSLIYGARLYGFSGAAIAFIGLVAPPFVVMILAGMAYAHYGALPWFRDGLTGLGAAAAGLLIATAVQMIQPLVRKDRVPQLLIALGVFTAIGVMQWPILAVLAVLVPLSIGFAWKPRL